MTTEQVGRLRLLLLELWADLVLRAQVPEVDEALRAAHHRPYDQQRSTKTFDSRRLERASQVAAAWVLSLLFVRTREDRSLLDCRLVEGEPTPASHPLVAQPEPPCVSTSLHTCCYSLPPWPEPMRSHLSPSSRL